jgi:hypothetical protein
MSCEICGRGACTRSFHSLEAQEAFDNPPNVTKEAEEYMRDVIEAALGERESRRVSGMALDAGDYPLD